MEIVTLIIGVIALVVVRIETGVRHLRPGRLLCHIHIRWFRDPWRFSWAQNRCLKRQAAR